MENRLNQVLGEVFELDAGEITDDSNPENVALWDSLHHLKMVTELEAIFEVRFTMREIRSMTTFSKIREILVFHLDGRHLRRESDE